MDADGDADPDGLVVGGVVVVGVVVVVIVGGVVEGSAVAKGYDENDGISAFPNHSSGDGSMVVAVDG